MKNYQEVKKQVTEFMKREMENQFQQLMNLVEDALANLEIDLYNNLEKETVFAQINIRDFYYENVKKAMALLEEHGWNAVVLEEYLIIVASF